MKTIVLLMLLAAHSPLWARSAPGFTQSWRIRSDLERPENVYFSKKSGNFFITNVAGPYGKKDGRGWITKALPGGTVLSEKWIEGFNAPKGITGNSSTLWITDIDEIVLVDVKSQKVTGRIPVPGSSYLNGITLMGPREAYVTDTKENRIYLVRNGKAEIFLESPKLNGPNGIAAIDSSHIAIASSGTRDNLGSIFILSTKTKSLKEVSAKSGTYDGIAVTDKNDFVVSDYKRGEVLLIDRHGKRKTLISGLFGPAGLYYQKRAAFVVVAESEAQMVTLYDAPSRMLSPFAH